MKAILSLAAISVATLVAGCAPGRYIDVDPIYPPVQQVHHTFYRAPDQDLKPKRIAVMDFKAQSGVGQVFADMLSAELFKQGFKVGERQNVDVLMNEIKMASSGAQALTDTQILQKIGQMAGVDIVIVGGVVQYNEEVAKVEAGTLDVQLPFQINARSEREDRMVPVPWNNTVIYRWKEAPPPTGLPVQSSVYASARAIDVATGAILWINTVNVVTAGISQVTGLERLGGIMAGNLAGKEQAANQLYIYNGEQFTYPQNWSQVKQAFGGRMLDMEGKTMLLYQWVPEDSPAASRASSGASKRR